MKYVRGIELCGFPNLVLRSKLWICPVQLTVCRSSSPTNGWDCFSLLALWLEQLSRNQQKEKKNAKQSYRLKKCCYSNLCPVILSFTQYLYLTEFFSALKPSLKPHIRKIYFGFILSLRNQCLLSDCTLPA